MLGGRIDYFLQGTLYIATVRTHHRDSEHRLAMIFLGVHFGHRNVILVREAIFEALNYSPLIFKAVSLGYSQLQVHQPNDRAH